MIGSAASGNADESGVLPSGMAYVLTSNYAGAGTDVTLTAVDTQKRLTESPTSAHP